MVYDTAWREESLFAVIDGVLMVTWSRHSCENMVHIGGGGGRGRWCVRYLRHKRVVSFAGRFHCRVPRLLWRVDSNGAQATETCGRGQIEGEVEKGEGGDR